MNRAGALLAVLLAGCAGLLQAPQVDTLNVHLLDARPAAAGPGTQPARDRVLAVSAPRARAGFDTEQMAYVRRPHSLEYFANNRWADTPSHMLAPLLAQALEQRFRVVVRAPSAVHADLRLDTELVRLQHDFTNRPSRVELVLRAQLVDLRGRQVLAAAEFEETENAPSEDAYGGVIAANRALQRMLQWVADFCAEHSGGD